MSEKDKTLKNADSDELEKTSGFKVTKGEDGVARITITKGVSENIMGVQDEKLAMCLQDQITRCIIITDRDNPVDLIHSKMHLIKGLEPTNELEALLVTQMTSVHFMAMDMMRRAIIKDQTVAGTTDNLNRANKLLSLFTRQAETLQKLRGKGQQSITVKHVNVSGGGQAIVGDVHHKGGCDG
ncbi:MAG: hypothetical protein KZQ84_08330 [Candidatus Thiodiazotropha sp. (ex Lucinoma borealis)]|nr:hypothetical protein [Candidatus Thiodiazotropha sp. (ex Lucinoma borealis)]